jgi:cyclase
VSIQKTVEQMIRAGKSRRDILSARVTAPYDAKVPGGQALLPAGLGTSADRFVSEIYEELGGR